MAPTQQEKGAAFRALHEGEPFVFPNPWDAGSAKVLAGLGFKALASTSSGFAFTLGKTDGAVTLDEVVEHAGALEEAAERVAAAVAAARALGFDFTLTARAENHIRGNPDLEDTIARLQAYEAAGADVLYAPGLRNGEEVRAVCDAVGRPVNVLAHKGLSMAEITAAGGHRVSVGGAHALMAPAEKPVTQ